MDLKETKLDEYIIEQDFLVSCVNNNNAWGLHADQMAKKPNPSLGTEWRGEAGAWHLWALTEAVRPAQANEVYPQDISMSSESVSLPLSKKCIVYCPLH